MKQFFGAFFGSVIGIIIATVIAVLIIVGAIKSSIGGALKDEHATSIVKDNSILRIELDGSIIDREVENPFAEIEGLKQFSQADGIGLNMLLRKIKAASADDKIKGIYLDMKNLMAGYANVTELRNALLDFKKSGKFVYCYAEVYDQRSYYLASAASKVFVNPQGAIEFKGLSMSLMFYKQTLEKLGVDMQVFRHGKFKSAVEPFLLDKMSEANRLQSETFLNSIWNSMLEGIAKERKVSIDDLNKWANELSIEDPESAVGKLVDATAYEDEVITELKKKTGVAEKDKLNFLEFGKYDPKTKFDAKDRNTQIVVIYASGNISSGDGGNDEIGSDRIAKAIREARLNDKVKAIILRVNSPGGSALASDVMWREVVLAKKAKPFIVSMGNLAASGGYYISCAADRIFAQPNTITGSIGVFGIIPNLQKAFEQKLGITIDTVNTNKHSHLGSPFLPIKEKEHEYIQKSVEKIYDVFTKRVAEGRKMEQSAVDSIGQGRVWSGADAIKIGLVDEIGGLDDAIAYAAKKANLKDYKLIEMPKQKHPFEELLGKAEDDVETRIIQKNLGVTYSYLKHIQTIISAKGVQARLPFEMVIE
ncbi:MAG: signal peptide peptidase SppA, type [Bacteroidetes bacterium]|jgi:protease-4|nr:signal peptide peptidase SppA, type [Bacteroidota bacterium]